MSIMAFMEAMSLSNIPLIAAFFIGLMTAFSPCPLATNITAIAYISKKIGSTKNALKTGIYYTLGRSIVYVLIAFLIIYLGINIQFISLFLQKYGYLILGPLLIIIGIFMLDLIKINFKSLKIVENWKEKLSKKGYLGSFLLGALFALSFCPFSAVMYFGMLIPLSIASKDVIFAPMIFGIATGLPVILTSYLLSVSVSKLAKVMKKIESFEKWIRIIAGAIFIIIGVYYSINAFFPII